MCKGSNVLIHICRFYAQCVKAIFEGLLICALDLEQMALPMCRKFSLRAIKGCAER